MNGHKAIDYVQQQTFDKELLLKVNRYLPRKGCSYDRFNSISRRGASFINVMECLNRIAKLDAKCFDYRRTRSWKRTLRPIYSQQKQ